MARRGNSEGTVFQRARDKKWVAELCVGVDDAGQRKMMRFTADSRKKAGDWLAERLGEAKKGTLVIPTTHTFGSFAEEWLRTTVRHDAKPSTWQCYAGTLRTYVIPLLGAVELSALTARDVAGMKNRLLTSGPPRASAKHRTKDHISAGTVRLALAITRRVLQVAVEHSIIPKNPAVASAVKPPRVESGDLKSLSPEEVYRFLDAAKAMGGCPGALFTTAVCTGLRLGELLGLRWSDVNLPGAVLKVRRNLVMVANRLIEGTPKSRSSVRDVPLIEEAVEALQRWHREQATYRLKLGEAWTGEWVFTTRIGTPIGPENLRHRHLPAVLKAANLPEGITPHALRHSCASWLNSVGVPLPTISKILGHSSVAITASVYTHVWAAQKREAVDKLQEAIRARKGMR